MSLKFAFPMSSADGYSQFESGNGIPLILVIELSMQDIDSLCNFKHLCPDGRHESFLIESFVGLDMDISEYEAQLKSSAIQYHSCASIDLLDPCTYHHHYRQLLFRQRFCAIRLICM